MGVMWADKLLAAVLNRAAADDDSLSEFCGRSVGLSVRGFSAVWRLDSAGRFFPVSPHIDADVTVRCGKRVRVDGDADLLNALSNFWRRADWPVAVSACFGEALAPRVLYLLATVTEALQNHLDEMLAKPDEAADYGKKVRQLRRSVTKLESRLNTGAC